MPKSVAVNSMDELSALLEVYSEATGRLQQSHDRLLSEVTRLSTELEQKNKLLARKTRLEVLGEMAAGVAHEIRNPLGGILLYAGLLERDLAGSPAPLRLVRSIMSGVRSLETIVDDLLSFTRGFEPSPRRCFLSDVAEEALKAAVGELARTDIRVVREYADPDVPLQADPELLRRAVLNLVLNAVQAMKKKGTLTVRTGTVETDGRPACRIEVTDTGPGISPDMLGRLFEPYVTSKEGGTGLGLAIARKVIESHLGEIEARNLDGGGACFRATLPAKRSDAPPRDNPVDEVMRQR